MRAHFGLPSVRNDETIDRRTPISVKFEIPYFTISGIQVRYLKIVEKSGYQALRKYIFADQRGFVTSLKTANMICALRAKKAQRVSHTLLLRLQITARSRSVRMTWLGKAAENPKS